MAQPILSIVIPVFGKFNFTQSALNDLFRLPEDHEIIVIDNASPDNTQEELTKLNKANFKYLRNDTNIGFGKACNKAYSASSGKHVMFLNNDIRVKSNHSNWTEPIIDALNTNDDCLIGPTGGLIDPSNDFRFVYETSDSNKPINYMSGWCLSASRNTWEKLKEPDSLGPFSPIFFCYFEDTDVGFRAKQLGISFKLIDIPVVHFGKTSARQLNISQLYNEGRRVFLERWRKR